MLTAVFFFNAGFIFAVLTFLALTGWWAVAPFRSEVAFPTACAALAGLILVPCAALAVHVILVMPYGKAVTIASGALIGASIFAGLVLGFQNIAKGAGTAAAIGLAAALFTAWAVTRADCFFDGPGLLYAFGTDHLGYAHMADWIRLSVSNTPLTPDPRDVYASYPDYLLKYDPRFGSFSLLALISVLSGRPGAFAYDLTCAVVLSAAALGLGGLFGRSRLAFVSLAVALITSAWFDLSRNGYLGKTVGYPATLLVIGLFFVLTHLARSSNTYPLGALGALTALVASATLMFNALMTGLFLGLLGSILLTFMMLNQRDILLRKKIFEYGRGVLVLGGLVVAAILTSGVIARPLYFGLVPMDVGWPYLFSRAAQIVGPDSGLTQLPISSVQPATLIALMLWISLGVIAIKRRSPEAVALILGPVFLIVVLYITDQQWRFNQTIGFYLPSIACGAAILLDDAWTANRISMFNIKSFLYFSFILIFCFNFLRIASAFRIFGGGSTPSLYRFSLAETDQLASAIGASGVAIDIGDSPHLNYFLVVELGRRRIPLQFSERSWRTFMGYRPWPAPQLEHAPALLIMTRSEANSGSPRLVLRTTQYDLLRQP